MILRISSLLIIVTFLSCRSEPSVKMEREGEPTIYGVETNDSDMLIAVTKARESFVEFKDALTSMNPDYNSFAIKVPFDSPQGKEHIWISEVSITNDKCYGIVSNDPHWTREVQFGDSVEINPETISDWKFLEGNKLHGGFSIRLLYNRMSPDEKEEFDRETGMILD